MVYNLVGLESGSDKPAFRIVQGAFVSGMLFLRRSQTRDDVPTLLVGSAVAFATVPGTNLEDLEEPVNITLWKNQVRNVPFLANRH